jgi:hypothetical protein
MLIENPHGSGERTGNLSLVGIICLSRLCDDAYHPHGHAPVFGHDVSRTDRAGIRECPSICVFPNFSNSSLRVHKECANDPAENAGNQAAAR